jgi:hypothetical protein
MCNKKSSRLSLHVTFLDLVWGDIAIPSPPARSQFEAASLCQTVVRKSQARRKLRTSVSEVLDEVNSTLSRAWQEASGVFLEGSQESGVEQHAL